MKSLNQYITEFVVKKHIDNSDSVDLDLPSGLRWATCNIGAEKPEEPGLLFQWGRIDGYKYDDKHNKFLLGKAHKTNSDTEYKEGDTLKPEDDVAYQTTKCKFRMPTVKEIEELIKYTNNEWTELNKVNGYKFISKKDENKWIFIPAAGGFNSFKRSFADVGIYGYVWSSSSDGLIQYLGFCVNKLSCYKGWCDSAHSVRGVI